MEHECLMCSAAAITKGLITNLPGEDYFRPLMKRMAWHSGRTFHLSDHCDLAPGSLVCMHLCVLMMLSSLKARSLKSEISGFQTSIFEVHRCNHVGTRCTWAEPVERSSSVIDRLGDTNDDDVHVCRRARCSPGRRDSVVRCPRWL